MTTSQGLNDKINRTCANLPNYCRMFIEYKKGHMADSSVYNYASDITGLLTWGVQSFKEYDGYSTNEMPVAWFNDLTAADIDKYMDYLTEYTTPSGAVRRNDNSAKSRKLSSIRALYRYLNKEGYTRNNPTEFIHNPKVVTKEHKERTSDEKDAILKAITTGEGYGGKKQNRYCMAFSNNLRLRNKALYLIVTETCLKIPDLPALNLCDYDPDNGNLSVPSRKSDGNLICIHMPDSVRIALEDYIAHDRKTLVKNGEEALFITSRGERLSLRSMQNTIKYYTAFALE